MLSAILRELYLTTTTNLSARVYAPKSRCIIGWSSYAGARMYTLQHTGRVAPSHSYAHFSWSTPCYGSSLTIRNSKPHPGSSSRFFNPIRHFSSHKTCHHFRFYISFVDLFSTSRELPTLPWRPIGKLAQSFQRSHSILRTHVKVSTLSLRLLLS